MRTRGRNIVDGSEIRRSPVDIENIPLFIKGVIYNRWLAGFLLSTVSTEPTGQKVSSFKLRPISLHLWGSKSPSYPSIRLIYRGL